MDITIRKGNLTDIQHIKTGLIDMWVEHARQEPNLLDEEEMRTVDVEKYYKDAFESDKSIILVAEVAGNFAGILRADVSQIPSFFKDNKILYLDDAYVAPEYRGLGIVGKLIAEIEKTAPTLGIKRIQARVYTYNLPMQKALAKAGYHMPHATWDKML